MTFKPSSNGPGQLSKNSASFVVPVTPPSALAPLSETTMINVLSSWSTRTQEFEEPTDVVIGVAEETGEHLHLARVEPALIV